jgi:HD-like signal output (HDOD) protein
MIEVEKYPCNDRREAERRENEVMKDMKAIMNTRSSFLTEDDKKKRDKKYYESNKQNIKEQQKNTENKTKNT